MYFFIHFHFSPSTKPGKHWFFVHRYNEDLYEVFDSLGAREDTIKKLPKYAEDVEFLSSKVQSFTTNSCGEFVCAFVIYRLHNLDCTLTECVNLFFRQSQDDNETIVKSFLQDE